MERKKKKNEKRKKRKKSRKAGLYTLTDKINKLWSFYNPE